MAKHVTKPENVLINAVRHLQKARQYKADKAKGWFSHPYADDYIEKMIEGAQKEVNKLVERYTQPVDATLQTGQKVIRGY